MPRRMHISERDVSSTVEIHGDEVHFVGEAHTLSVRGDAGHLVATDGSATWRGTAAVDRDIVWIDIDGDIFECRPDSRAGHSAVTADDALRAPMPATVVRIAVAPEQRVQRGDLLIALEAMKMELPIRAPRDGVVGAVHCRTGELVQPGTLLVDLHS